MKMSWLLVYCIAIAVTLPPVTSIEPGERGSIHGTNFDELLAPPQFGTGKLSDLKSEKSSVNCDSRVAEDQFCSNQLKEALQNISVLNKRCDLIANPAIKEAPFTRRVIRNVIGLSKNLELFKDIERSAGESLDFELVFSFKRKDLELLSNFVDKSGDENLIDVQNLLINGLKYQKVSGKSRFRLFVDFYLPDLDVYLKLSTIMVSCLFSIAFLVNRVRVHGGRQTFIALGFLVFLADFVRALYFTYLEQLAIDIQFYARNTCDATQQTSLTHWILGRDDCAEMNMKALISPFWRISLLEVFSKTLGCALVGIAGPLGQSLQVYLGQISWYYLPFALFFVLVILLILFGFNIRLQLPFVRFDVNINQNLQNARVIEPRIENLNGLEDIPRNIQQPVPPINQPIENHNAQPQIANEIATNDIGQPIRGQNGFAIQNQILVVENVPGEIAPAPDQGVINDQIRGQNAEIPSGYQFQQLNEQPGCSQNEMKISKCDVSSQTESRICQLAQETATDPDSITDLMVSSSDSICVNYNIVNSSMNNLNQ